MLVRPKHLLGATFFVCFVKYLGCCETLCFDTGRCEILLYCRRDTLSLDCITQRCISG